MELIRDISDILKWAKVSVNLESEVLIPSANEARDKVIDILGLQEYQSLVTAYGGETDTTTADQKALLPYVQKSLVNLTLEEYFTTGLSEISNAGAHLSQSKDRKGLPPELRKEQQKRYHDNGYAALQQLLQFLHSSPTDKYMLWRASEEKEEYLSLFCNTAKEFSKYYDISNNFYLFLKLRPSIRDVEKNYVIPTLGEELSAEIKAQIQNRNLSPNNKALLQVIHAALAPLTIFHGLPKNSDTFSEVGLLQHASSLNFKPEITQPSIPELISLRLRDAEKMGYKNIQDLRSYLIKKATLYPLFQVPEESNIQLNSKEKSIFTML